ncbi:MAG TPA: HNH endonuclease signature motif containing protein [Gemmatimonadaceae bacterium]|nr:HNH endonuclease signature motif containing protein [Gemmatimonadaceae bacterium]
MSRLSHDSPYRDAPTRVAPTPASPPAARRVVHERAPRPSHDAYEPPASDAQHTKTGRSRRAGRRSRRGGYAPPQQLTSHPTGRAAYVETRNWLLEQHGPVCAYCGRRFTEAVMTLDHVAPRRGQTAYDRRDNLVLACPGCNALKRDLAPAAFLLTRRNFAANLLRYGAHLSPMLVDLARSLAPADALTTARANGDGWDDLDDESPYRD